MGLLDSKHLAIFQDARNGIFRGLWWLWWGRKRELSGVCLFRPGGWKKDHKGGGQTSG